LARYGQSFLDVLITHNAEPKKTEKQPTETETLILLRQGKTLEEVADLRGFTHGTIYSHAASLIEQGHLQLEDVISLEQEELDQIMDVMLAHSEEPVRLKPIFEELGGAYSYDILKCVHAALQREISAPDL